MIKELRVGNYVAYKGKPSLVCALDYDPKLRKENISVVYKWGEPPYKTNGDIQPILLTEKLVLQCGFNQLDDYTFDNDEMEITQDWDEVKKGQKMAVVRGDIRVLLCGERTALNYLQRMSGIATYTNGVAKLLAGTKTKLLDTRKTSPNNRIFEKYAVRIGGGNNHRYNLTDGVLLKDNHIGAAGGVKQAVTMAKEYAPFVRKIEVEVENLSMVREAMVGINEQEIELLMAERGK